MQYGAYCVELSTSQTDWVFSASLAIDFWLKSDHLNLTYPPGAQEMKKTRLVKKQKIKPLKRRVYKSPERRERLRIYELYDGPSTDTAATIRMMDQIHRWIKTGNLPELAESPSKKLVAKLIDKNP